MIVTENEDKKLLSIFVLSSGLKDNQQNTNTRILTKHKETKGD